MYALEGQRRTADVGADSWRRMTLDRLIGVAAALGGLWPLPMAATAETAPGARHEGNGSTTQAAGKDDVATHGSVDTLLPRSPQRLFPSSMR